MNPSERTFLAAFRAWRKARDAYDGYNSRDAVDADGNVTNLAWRLQEAERVTYRAWVTAQRNLDDPIADRPPHLTYRVWRKRWKRMWKEIGARYRHDVEARNLCSECGAFAEYNCNTPATTGRGG